MGFAVAWVVLAVWIAFSGAMKDGEEPKGWGRVAHGLWLVPAAALLLRGITAWTEFDVQSADVAPGIEPVWGRGMLYIALMMVGLVVVALLLRFFSWWRRPSKLRWVSILATVSWTASIALVVLWPRIGLFESVDTSRVVGALALFVAGLALLNARHRAWRLTVAVLVGVGLGAYFGLDAVTDDPNTAYQWLAVGVVGLLPTLSAEWGRKDAWRWGGLVSALGLALVVMMVAAAGSVAAFADFLDRADKSNITSHIAVPAIEFLSVYNVLALVLLGAIVMTVLAAVIHLVRVRLDVWRPQREALKKQYRQDELADNQGQPPRHQRDCVDQVTEAAIADRSIGTAARDADVLLTTLVSVAMTAVVLGVLRFVLSEPDWGAFLGRLEAPVVADDWKGLVTIAIRGAALLPLVGVAFIRSAISDENSRKSLGAVWDVLTFWPRRFHPLAPPSYAERAVPELATRIEQLTDDNATVMVTAHSQGCVVAAATVAWLGARQSPTDDVYLVTHGNPLGRLYQRAFPGYWGNGMLRYLRSRLKGGEAAGWLNLHRITDPIGDQIFTGTDESVRQPPTPGYPAGDEHLPDPATRWSFELDACMEASGHSHYLKQQQSIVLLDELAATLNGPPPPGGAPAV